MTADTYSNTLGFLVMGTGNDNNTWGTNCNTAVFQVLEDAIANMLTSSVTGGTLDLSGSPPPAAASQARYEILKFTGTLGSTQTVIVPNLTKRWTLLNATTGDILMKAAGGSNICIPHGSIKIVVCDGATGLFRLDRAEVGKISAGGYASAPAGELACDGSYYLRTALPDLFSVISTTWGNTDSTNFRVPLLTDTGRFLRSSGPTGVGNYQANQNLSHSHSASTSVSIIDPTHGHAIIDGTHGHSLSISDTRTWSASFFRQTTTAGTGGGFNFFNEDTAANTTVTVSVSGGSIGGSAIAASSNVSNAANSTGISANATTDVVASGGTEARPESAVVFMTIRY